MKKRVLLISLALLFCIVGLRVPPVYAVLFGFSNITNNSLIDAEIGEDQLFVDLTFSDVMNPTLSDRVLFSFQNSGPEQCSITQIYFDGISENLLLTPVAVSSTGVVAFSPITDPTDPTHPWNLPGGQSVGFEAEYRIGAIEPQPINGVNPLETFGIVFEFGTSNGDPFEALLANLEMGETRIGIHVQAFASGGSESFVSVPIPEPSTMLLLGVGLIGLAGIGRKKFVKNSGLAVCPS